MILPADHQLNRSELVLSLSSREKHPPKTYPRLSRPCDTPSVPSPREALTRSRRAGWWRRAHSAERSLPLPRLVGPGAGGVARRPAEAQATGCARGLTDPGDGVAHEADRSLAPGRQSTPPLFSSHGRGGKRCRSNSSRKNHRRGGSLHHSRTTARGRRLAGSQTRGALPGKVCNTFPLAERPEPALPGKVRSTFPCGRAAGSGKSLRSLDRGGAVGGNIRGLRTRIARKDSVVGRSHALRTIAGNAARRRPSCARRPHGSLRRLFHAGAVPDRHHRRAQVDA